MSRIGFLVNPIAGMGGRVGLKGTDGDEVLKDAIRKGAKPLSPERGARFLEELRRRNKIELTIAPGRMGEDVAHQLHLEHQVIGQVGQRTSAEDTIRITGLMIGKVDLIVFCGGDGTARDVLTGVGQEVPTLGVPGGVKVYSSVFAITPVAAADSAYAFLHGQIQTRLGEVVDVDEEAFRRNRLSVRLFGHLATLDSGPTMQASKSPTISSEDVEVEAIADQVLETISPDTKYILGPGSTVEKIARRLGITKTLLGVDVVQGDGTLLGEDVDESNLVGLVRSAAVKIIVSPIGGQGFLFGRGNQQISPKVLRSVGVKNVIIVAAKDKIESLRPRRLLIDSGDDEIDKQFRGYARVITGYREEMVVKVE